MPSTSYFSSRARRIRPATSAASADVRDPVEQDGELVATEPGNRVRRAHGALEALRHLPQDRVAGRVAEAVVDGLEVVQVDEHDADRPAAADRAHDRLLDAVCEQRSVGEARDRVVEGLVCELILERLALADVATVQDDAADVLVLQQVCVLNLELEPGAVSMPERALDHVGLRAAADVGLADARQDLRQPRPVGHADQLGEVTSLHLVRAIAEDTLDRRALVRDGAMGVEDGDEVARVGDQRPESSFALATVQVLCQQRSLDGERDLRSKRLERVDELAGYADRRAQDEQATRLVTNRERQNQHGVAVMKVKLVLHLLGQSRERDLLSCPGRLAEPAVGVLRHMPFALVTGRGGNDCALSVQQDETDCRRLADESKDRRDGSLVDLLATAGRDELDARPSQRKLARCRSLLLAHQTDHAGHDEKEQQRRRDDQHENVRVAEAW